VKQVIVLQPILTISDQNHQAALGKNTNRAEDTAAPGWELLENEGVEATSSEFHQQIHPNQRTRGSSGEVSHRFMTNPHHVGPQPPSCTQEKYKQSWRYRTVYVKRHKNAQWALVRAGSRRADPRGHCAAAQGHRLPWWRGNTDPLVPKTQRLLLLELQESRRQQCTATDTYLPAHACVRQYFTFFMNNAVTLILLFMQFHASILWKWIPLNLPSFLFFNNKSLDFQPDQTSSSNRSSVGLKALKNYLLVEIQRWKVGSSSPLCTGTADWIMVQRTTER